MTEQSLGEFLRNEREKRGITLEQIVSATKVSLRLLQALEEDHFAELPAKPFVRGFVSSYCRFLGLDPRDVLIQFGSFIDRKTQVTEKEPASDASVVFERRDAERSRRFLWIIVGVFLVCGGLIVFVVKPTLKHRKEAQMARLQKATQQGVPAETSTANSAPAVVSVAAVSAQSASAPATPSVPSEPPATPAAPPVTAPAAPVVSADAPRPPEDMTEKADPLNKGDTLKPEETKHKIVLKAFADVWVRYRVDDKPVMRFMLRKDRLLVLKSVKGLAFQASNPNSISIQYRSAQYYMLRDWKSIQYFNKMPTVVLAENGTASNSSDPFPDLSPLPSSPNPE